MVRGLDVFRSFFDGYEDCYALIGGTACDLNFSSVALPFRATRDFDIVLYVEALTPGFFRTFWRFVVAGGYERREKSNGARCFYRFSHPHDAGFPMLIELFSRKAVSLPAEYDGILTPIPAGEEASSLSAILLDDSFYRFILENRQVEDGVSFASPIALVVLKAMAWLDLRGRRAAGDTSVNAHDVSKHKNDIARLVAFTANQETSIPQELLEKMPQFAEQFAEERIDTSSLGLGMTQEQIIAEIRRLFGK